MLIGASSVARFYEVVNIDAAITWRMTGLLLVGTALVLWLMILGKKRITDNS